MSHPGSPCEVAGPYRDIAYLEIRNIGGSSTLVSFYVLRWLSGTNEQAKVGVTIVVKEAEEGFDGMDARRLETPTIDILREMVLVAPSLKEVKHIKRIFLSYPAA